jgi:hypothetical protein
MANWQKLFDAVKDGFEVVADKAGEYGKKGRIKYDMYQIKRKSLQELSRLGSVAYSMILDGRGADIADDKEAVKSVQAIRQLEEDLKVKEREFVEVGKEKGPVRE